MDGRLRRHGVFTRIGACLLNECRPCDDRISVKNQGVEVCLEEPDIRSGDGSSEEDCFDGEECVRLSGGYPSPPKQSTALVMIAASQTRQRSDRLTFQLVMSATSLVLATRYLERIWGFVELMRFSLLVVVLSNVVAFGFSWIAWFILGQDEFM